MALINCPECRASMSEKAVTCPKCGHPMKPLANLERVARRYWRGYEWKTKAQIFGWPLIHIAIGRNGETGRLMVAKGIIAIGQFGIGVLFGLGQFVGGIFSIGQFALGIIFAFGQFACGITAVGQIAFGSYVRAQIGFGSHVWSSKIKDPQAIGYFSNLWYSAKSLAI